MSTLSALRISHSSLSIPYYGTARFDGVLEQGDPPPIGPATVTIGSLAMAGTILSAEDDAPDLPHAVWVNGAAWDLPLPTSRGYGTDAGVRLSTVLRDLLADVNAAGKTVGYAVESYAAYPADRPIEREYLRPADTTGREVLATLKRAGLVPGWWIDGPGALHFGPRPSGPSTGRADVMRRNAGAGLRVFGLDDPAGFLPGTTLENVATMRLRVRERAASLSAEAWSKGESIRDAVANIARRDRPEARYAYPRTFVVRAVGSDGRLDLSPPPDAPDLHALDRVEQWTMGSALTLPAVGTSVVVAFRDARESRAVVIGIAPSAPGAAVARVGDHAGRLIFDAATGILYYSPSDSAPYVPVTTNLTTPTPPIPAQVGTVVTIATGSSKVVAQ